MKFPTLKILFSIGVFVIMLFVASPVSHAQTSAELYAQATTLEQDAATLEAQAASIQAVNPAGAQTLRTQAASLKQQAVNLKKQADSYKDDEMALQAAAYEIEADQLELQAAAIQVTNPAGAQALYLQAAALRQQAASLREQIKTGRPVETIYGDPGLSAEGPASAQTKPQILPQYKLIVPIPGFQPKNEADPLAYIVAIYNVAIAAGGLIAMGIIVFGGLKWATSAGNPSATSEAKDLILHAVYGLVMLMGATLILYTIGGDDFTKLTLQKLKPITATDFDFGAASADATRQRQADVRAAEKMYENALAEQKKLEAEADKKTAAGEKLTIDERLALATAKLNTAKALTAEKHAAAVAARAVYDQALAAIAAYNAGFDVLDFIQEASFELFGHGGSQYRSLTEIENQARINWSRFDDEEKAAREAEAIAQQNVTDLQAEKSGD